MMNNVAQVLGYSAPTVSSSYHLSERIRKISESLSTKPGDAGFEDEVNSLEVQYSLQGNAAIASFVGVSTAPIIPREPKIKCVDKGKRIGIKSASGVNFSFGSKWIESVKTLKGIALHPNHREKLNMHGTYHEVPDPEKMTPRDLCLAIAARM